MERKCIHGFSCGSSDEPHSVTDDEMKRIFQYIYSEKPNDHKRDVFKYFDPSNPAYGSARIQADNIRLLLTEWVELECPEWFVEKYGLCFSVRACAHK